MLRSRLRRPRRHNEMDIKGASLVARSHSSSTSVSSHQRRFSKMESDVSDGPVLGTGRTTTVKCCFKAANACTRRNTVFGRVCLRRKRPVTVQRVRAAKTPPTALKDLTDIVDSAVNLVSKAARRGSLVAMLTVVRTLERNNGTLPTGFFGSSMDTFFGQCFKFGTFKRTEYGMTPDMPRATTSNPWILATLRDPRVTKALSKHRVRRQSGDSNLLQAAANTYQTNFVSFFDYELPRRVKTMVKALWRRSYPVYETPRPKGQLARAVNYATVLVDGVPEPVGVPDVFLQAVRDLRSRHLAAVSPAVTATLRADVAEVTRRRSAELKNSERWKALSAELLDARRRVKYAALGKRIEFVYWLLQRLQDMEVVDDVVYKKFAMAPLAREQRAHITIDGNVFKDYLFPRLKEIGYYAAGMTKAALDDPDIRAAHLAALFPGCENLRSRRQGWESSQSFKTDGYSLCASFARDSNLTTKRGSGPKRVPESKKKKAVKRAKKLEGTFNSIPNGAVVVGCDMGIVFPYAVAWVGADGKLHTRLLSRYAYKKLSGIKTHEKIMARRQGRLEEAHRPRSETTTKSSHLRDVLGYTTACDSSWEETWKQNGDRRCSRSRMASFIGRERVLTRFWNDVIRDVLESHPGKTRGDVYVATGFPDYNCCTRGCPASPTTAAFKAMKRAVQVVPTDEYNTSQVCARCLFHLDKPKIRTTLPDGRVKYQELRGFRLCQQCFLTSRVQPVYSWETDRWRGYKRFHRDINAAIALFRVAGKRNEDRPEPLRRPNSRQRDVVEYTNPIDDCVEEEA